jgi:hypothetical protein
MLVGERPKGQREKIGVPRRVPRRFRKNAPMQADTYIRTLRMTWPVLATL